MAKSTTAATTTAPVVDNAAKFAAAINARINPSVIAEFDRSFDAASSGAFQEALRAAHALGLTTDELLEWRAKTDNAIELALDAFQYQTHARDCSRTVLDLRSRLLRLAVLAGSAQTRELIQQIKNEEGKSVYGDIPKYTFDAKVPEEANRDAAQAALDDMVIDARERGDNAAAVLFSKYLDAQDNVEKIVRLFKEQRVENTNRSRWRNGFILHHVGDLIQNCADDYTLEPASLWRDAVAAANKARTKLVATGNGTGPQLLHAMREATREALAAKVKAAEDKTGIKKVAPESERAATYVKQVWAALRKLSELESVGSFKPGQVAELCGKLTAEYGDIFRDTEEEDRVAELAKGKGTAATSSPLANAASTPPVAPASGTVTQKSEGAAASEATKPRRTSKKQAFVAPPAPEASAPSLPDPTEE